MTFRLSKIALPSTNRCLGKYTIKWDVCGSGAYVCDLIIFAPFTPHILPASSTAEDSVFKIPLIENGFWILRTTSVVSTDFLLGGVELASHLVNSLSLIFINSSGFVSFIELRTSFKTTFINSCESLVLVVPSGFKKSLSFPVNNVL